jgi:hypothetical protein
VLRRREQDGLALAYSGAELVTLMREVQVFVETAQRARHATSNMLTLVPTPRCVYRGCVRRRPGPGGCTPTLDTAHDGRRHVVCARGDAAAGLQRG